ncbi:hypothetical protein [Cellulomonas sp. RIT-PI-Y]|uniref:hypothetical protein n=1 Tax=Cellulomonas sp. RIT-PI-Y TaxID=3035297 RepID=UPI0021DAF692|nr:hypothetical protein [Cellulomonas sp. RIT-PI-Y]
MPASAESPAAPTRLTVDGEDFEVTELAPGRWEGEIRGFLAEIDPETGYLE